MQEENLQQATFGAGCFWCSEAVFQRLKGVKQVEPGYAGGQTENPTYKQVCAGGTGHIEVSRITFDANIISYKQLLTVF
ncbi:MAG TPA: peptide-methionine (S)-S-oxide reductase, partial [Balneolaceae bacterium]|nr:peptide-methionine (S)-S-oxide reductase [Balneolaceae bacterium]